jgi:hypothetical protein
LRLLATLEVADVRGLPNFGQRGRGGPSALAGFVPGADACRMAWFFRAIETDEGRWECHHGARVFDEHPTLAEALEHLRGIAADQPEAAQLFVHTLDGQVRWEGAT